MNGFLLKDFFLLKSTGKLYGVMAAIFFLLTCFQVYDASFLFFMVPVLLSMFPSTSFSYDELVKWDRFAVAVPGGRAGVVKAKYQFSLLLAGGSFALNLIMALVLTLFNRTKYTPTDTFLLCFTSVCCCLLLNVLLLPLLFRLGAQKARVAMVLCIALVAGAGGALAVIGSLSYSGSFALSPLVALPIFVLLLGLLFLSYQMSLKIYSKKDF